MSALRKFLMAAVLSVSATAALALDPLDVAQMLSRGVGEQAAVNVVAAEGLSRPLTGQDVNYLYAAGASVNLVNYLASVAPQGYARPPVVVVPPRMVYPYQYRGHYAPPRPPPFSHNMRPGGSHGRPGGGVRPNGGPGRPQGSQGRPQGPRGGGRR